MFATVLSNTVQNVACPFGHRDHEADRRRRSKLLLYIDVSQLNVQHMSIPIKDLTYLNSSCCLDPGLEYTAFL